MIPRRLRTRPKDSRGLPVPFIVLIDNGGVPQFTINDTRLVFKCLSKKLCSICGSRLEKVMWFVGGPQSAFSPHGGYIDPPVHRECGEYALKTCPYLAMPRYARNIGTKKLSPDQDNLVLVDPTTIPDRPELFVIAATGGYDTRPFGSTGRVFLAPQPWLAFEFWKQGSRMPTNEGIEVVSRLGLTVGPPRVAQSAIVPEPA